MKRLQNYLPTILLLLFGLVAKAQPLISSFAPLSGAPGSSVTLTGSFSADPAKNIVYFGATRGTVTASTGASLTVTVPAGASHAPISVLNADGGLTAFSNQYFVPTFTPARPSPLQAADFTLNGHIPTGITGQILPIHSGDLDNDGKPDLVMSISAPGINKIYIRKNTSTTNSISFASPVENTIPGINVPGEQFTIGDIDGDGLLDVVVPGLASDNFAVMRNTGTLSGFATTTFAAGDNPTGAALADFDGDGKPDVIVGNYLDGNISVFRNNGAGPGSISFETGFTISTGGGPLQLATGDFNGDGKPDILAIQSGNKVKVLQNTSTGSAISFWASDINVMNNPSALIAGDLDNDGNLDVIITSNNASATKFGILRNTGGSNIAFAYQEVEAGLYQRYASLGDLNGDGKLDLVMAMANNSASYQLGVFTNTSTSGSISFSSQFNLAAQAIPFRNIVLDFNGDGRPDLLASNSATFSLYRNTLQYPPVITDISPLRAAPGTSITITGASFNTDPVKNIVYFGGVKAAVTASTGTGLTVTVPIGASHAPVSVLNTHSGLSAYSQQYFVPTFTPGRPSTLGAEDFTLDGNIASTGGIYRGASGDFDLDGKPDLVIAPLIPTYDKMYIRKNTSTATAISFGPIIENTVPGTDLLGDNVAVGDIDGDGRLDIVANGRSTNNFAVMRNTGTLSAFSTSTFAAGNSPTGVALADFDGDGKLDVAVSNASESTLSVFRNTSTGPGSVSFAAAVTVSTISPVGEILASDFNGDGKPDILAPRRTTNAVRVLQNTSSGGTISFSISDITVLDRPYSLAAGDLDSDGDLDVIVGPHPLAGTKFGILTNTGSGAIGFSYQEIDAGYKQKSAALSDLNGDGKPDLMLGLSDDATSFYKMAVFTNTTTSGTITFSSPFNLPVQRSPSYICALDFNGDGRSDLVSFDANMNALSLYRNTLRYPPVITTFSAPGASLTLTGSGFNATPANNIVYFGPVKAAVTAATASTLTVTVPLGATHSLITVTNTGNSMTGYSLKKFLPVFSPNKTSLFATDFAARATITTVLNPNEVVVADFDGDGKPELLTDNTANEIAIHQNTSNSGTISFDNRSDLTTSMGVRYMGIGDVDGDGKLDFAVPTINSNRISIFRNTGNGSINFAAKVDLVANTGPVNCKFGDLDSDGKPELIVCNYGAGSLSVFRNTTTGTSISFEPKIDFVIGNQPLSPSVTDIDGDGKPDIVVSVSNSAENKIMILRNTGSGTISFAPLVSLSTGASPWLVQTGDLDGDGKPDIVVPNSNSHNVSVFLNRSTNGTISFMPQTTFATRAFPGGVDLGDLNGDGRLDMVIANQNDNSLSVFTNASNSGILSFAAPFVLSMPVDTKPEALVVADLDGDGRQDIAAADGGSNTVSIYRNQLITKPVIQASVLTFNKQTTTSSLLSWTNGSGQKRAVFVKAEETTGAPVPIDDTDYTADAAFLNGSQIGTSGWYCVYSGTGLSVTVTGLDPLKPYRAMVIEFSDNGMANVATYLTTTATGNPLNFIPASAIKNITRAITTPTDAATITYNVVLETPITGLTTANFDLATTGITGASITNLTGSNKNYTVTVNTGTGDGTITLQLVTAAGLDHPFTNTLPFTGETYTIDKVSPAYSTSTLPAAAIYPMADEIDLSVTFSEPVLVNAAGGIPSIDVTLATGGIVKANYFSGSGSATLTFRYTVTPGNEDLDGITLATTINLNGGTIKDAFGHDASLTVSFPSAAAILVDGIAPSVSAINRNLPTLATTNATSVVFRITFSESVSGVDVNDFTLDKTGTVNGTVASVSASSGTSIDVIVNNITGNGNLGLNLNATSTGIVDAAGNAISGGFAGQIYAIDQSLPTLQTVSIASNNMATNKAKTGDAVTLNFTASEAIATPTVTIASHTVTPTNTLGNNWTASYLLSNTDIEGNVPFSIAFSDLTGNVGTTVNATTNSSNVTFDKTAPTISPVALASNNSQASQAKTGDVVTLNFTASEAIAAPTVTIATHAVTPINTSGNNWMASYAFTNTDTEGNVPFTVAFNDLTGNIGTTVTATTNSSSVTFDRTVPLITPVTIASNNSNPTKARANDVITISFSSNEPIVNPTVSIFGKPVLATNTGGNNWKIAYTVVAADADGVAPFSIQATDLAGNSAAIITATTNGSSVTIDRPSSINTLAALVLSSGTLSPAFSSQTLNYNVVVSYPVNAIAITPSATDLEALVRVNGNAVAPGSSSQNITLNLGANSITVTVMAPDLSASRTYNIAIQREGDAASDIIFASSALYENSAIGTPAGTLASISSYSGNTFTYTLVTGSGDTDNGLFTVNADKIVTAGILNYENKATYQIRVRSTNQFGLFAEKQLVINLQDVNEAPTLAAIANQSICFTSSPQSIALTAIGPGQETGQPVSLSVTSSNGNFFTNLTVSAGGNGNGTLNYTLKNDVSGTVTITVTVKDNGGIANGGIDQISRSFTLTVNSLPVPQIVSDLGTTVSLGLTAHLTASGGTSYQWANATGIINGQNSAMLTVRPTAITTYTVTVTNASGCTSMESITLDVQNDLRALKPTNVLTPNNDGRNDKFIIQNIDLYPNNSLKIFDRNGRILYTKRGYANEWDGTYQGNPLAEDTYYYVLDFGTGVGPFSGYISIVRRN